MSLPVCCDKTCPYCGFPVKNWMYGNYECNYCGADLVMREGSLVKYSEVRG